MEEEIGISVISSSNAKQLNEMVTGMIEYVVNAESVNAD